MSRPVLILALAAAAFAQSPAAVSLGAVSVIDLSAGVSLDQLAAQLAAKRVIFIGENHDRYDHHLNQLEIIRRLHQIDPSLVLGVEFFQQPFQQQVDDYIGGRTTEQVFLRATEYFQGWGWDYRLYAPIFRFARDNAIPVRALNVPNSLPSQVGKVGLAGLSAAERATLPKEMGTADEAYRKRLREAFESHSSGKPGAFDRFVEAQLVWDEGMAESAAAYLSENPGRRMVILAGAGHLMFGAGIPQRLERRIHAPYAIVLNGGVEAEPRVADFLVLSEKQELPAAGVLGVRLEDKDGECRIRSLTPGGAAEKAGLKAGDVIADIDDGAIKRVADTRLALWEKKPGDRARIRYTRNRRFGSGETRDVEIELTAPAKER